MTSLKKVQIVLYLYSTSEYIVKYYHDENFCYCLTMTF